MEAPPQGSSQVPPIATTPPQRGLKEELLSQSSSGTQISNTSGVSLGEAIRRRSLMTQDPELWYRPCAETDISNVMGWRLGQTPGGCNITEFPTMEEGLLTPTGNFSRPQASGMTHSPILEMADSQLSPNLPLLTTNATQGQTFFNETVFQPTGLEFAPLRATPDVSAAAAERPLARLPIGEAVQLAARDVGPESSQEASLSQHPLAFSLTAPNNATLGSYLSQHPLTFSEPVPAQPESWPMLHADLRAKTLDPKEENSRRPHPPMWPSQPLATQHLPDESWGATPSQDVFLLDNSLPAPLLLDLLEDEMGLPKHGGFLSSEGSSCKSGLGKDPGENVIQQLTVNVALSEGAPKLTLELRQSKGQTTPPPESPRLFTEAAAGKPWRRASDPGAFSANFSPALVSSGAHPFSSLDSSVIPKRTPVPTCQRAGEKFQSGAEEDQRKFTPAPVGSKPCASSSFQPVPAAADVSERMGTTKAILTSVSQNELTLSDGNVEREPRNTGISPFDEASFVAHLAHPIHHSTPGFGATRSLNREAPGTAFPSRSGFQRPLSCLREEMSKTSPANARNSSVVEPHGNPCLFPTKESFTSHGTPGLRNEKSDGFTVLQPLKGRIQSMPSLNFMEKVGAWHLSSSAEKLPDVSAVPCSGTPVPGSGGVAPMRRAYGAIADSLSRILLKQQSLVDLKAASFYGPSSMTDLHSSQNELPPRALPFTRSQSETSVSALSREISRTDIGSETRPNNALQQKDVRAYVSTDSRLKPAVAAEEAALHQCYKAVPVVATVSSDEESVSMGSHSDPLIRSRRVAELLRGETSSLEGSKEELGGPQEKTRDLSGCGFRAAQVRMDYFRDLSPDHLNQGTDSGTDSCTDLRLSSRQSSRSSPALNKLQSSLEDELQTSNHSELNIDERIPVYLHNLGIDQSPSSILTPFMPRGPIREIEFSPTELRTLKASSDLFRLHLSEDSPKDATQLTFNSSLLCGLSLAGSAVVSDSSQPAKPSPQHTRDLLPPSGSPWKPHAVTPPLTASVLQSPSAPVSTEEAQVIPGSPSSLQSSTTRLASPEDNLDPRKLGASQVKSGSSSQDQKPASEGIRSSGTIPSGERDDSFTRSNVPKESQKLPAEVDSRPSSAKFRSPLSLSSSSGSLKPIDRGDLSGDPGSIQRSTLGIQRGWSWDERVSKQEVTGSLKWEDLQRVDFLSEEPTVPQELRPRSQRANEDRGMTQPIARSDPEGCPRTAVNWNLPVPTGRSTDSRASPCPTLREIRSVSDTDDVSKLLRDFPRVEQKANGSRPKEIGGSQESTDGSSVDSLGRRVKKLLQYGHPAMHRTPRMEERDGSAAKEPSVSGTGSAFGRGNVGAQGSSNGSSMDSLAVRVQALLEEEQPVLHATQILRSVEEEEEKARAWVKLKLATEPQYFIPELTEEDRRMIERMKREQLSTSGETEHLENQQWRRSFQRLPNTNPDAMVEPGSLQKPRDHDLQMTLQKYGLQLAEFSGENTEPAMNGGLTAEPEVKLSRGAQIPVSGQWQPPPSNTLDSKANSHLPLDTHLQGASKSPAKEDGNVAAPLDLSESSTSVEAAIQITSITFASRRRSPSPASRPPRSLLADVPPRDPVSSETRPANRERQKLDGSQLPSYQARPSAGVASARASEKGVASPPLGSTKKVARDDPRRGDLGPSLEGSPRRGVEPKDLVRQAREDKKASDPGLPEQRRYAKTLGNIYTNGSKPERLVASPPPKAGEVRPQNCSPTEAGSAPKPLFPEGKEKTRQREDLSTSDSYLHKPRSRGGGSTSLLQSASLDCISAAVPVSPTSPTRKALSGVHLTLSPKRVEVDLSGPVAIGPERREVEVPKPTTSGVPSPSLEATSKPTESKRKTQGSSYFPQEASSQEVPKGARPALPHAQEPRASQDGAAAPSPADAGTRSSSARDHLKATASSQTEWRSSDAITQITTESPEKTTYSAEIFVTAENGEAPYPKAHKTPDETMLGISKISGLDGQSGEQPLVLPYKPPGCSEVYYVPCGKGTLKLSRVRSETTVESSHSGSNDAVPPDFPPQVLGSRKDHPSDTAIVRHKEGIYSKKAAPRVAWMEEKAVAAATTVVGPRGSCSGRDPSASLRTCQPAFESAQPPLKSPLQDDPNPPPGSKALGQVDAASGGPAPSPQDLLPRKGILESSPSPQPLLHLSQREESFIPLTGEVDYSFLEEIKFNHFSQRDWPDAQRTSLGRASQLPWGSRPIKEKRVADLPRGPSTHRSSPLDALWAKYLERQIQQRQRLKPVESNHRTELSLVERLDRLARLLQNPLRHSLALALEDQKAPRRKAARLGSPRDKTMAARKKAASRPSTETSEEALVGPSGAWPSKSRRPKTGHGEVVERGPRNWDGGPASETPSEMSSDLRPGRDASVATGATSESGGTRNETESATPTEASESASTINTARLIRAFGQERVQVSPKLSQLYSTIDLQKTRSESWAKRGRRAKGDGGYPKMVHIEQKQEEAQPSPSFTSSESVSSLGSSHGPSPALSSKRMSHKAVQAGEFEIVNSATKKHTRDVGLTFPTPTPSQGTLHGGSRSRAEQRLAQHHGLSAEDEEQQKWQPGGFLEGRRPRRSRSQWTQGVSWFVPAADLKADPLEEARGGFPPGPVLAWSEPPPRGKPWREPLREQNWPERLGGLQVRLAAPARDVENEPPSPLGKMTLQESLAMHRPDFISSSGERLKRLKLLTEERKLQSVFQGEREQLFHPPEAMSCRNMGGLANRGYRTVRSRAISKNEMVERSKRIYEQLPEVRKRREEAKRKTEYSTNRLKAQLYKTKITNHVLGRKVPWE